jgi:hypothetical protein
LSAIDFNSVHRGSQDIRRNDLAAPVAIRMNLVVNKQVSVSRPLNRSIEPVGCSISAPLIKDAKPVFENSVVSIVRDQHRRSQIL